MGRQVFLKHKTEPVNDYIELPQCVGLGMALDEAVIESRKGITF